MVATWRREEMAMAFLGSQQCRQGEKALIPVKINVLAGIENIKPGDVGHQGQGKKNRCWH